MHKAIHLRKLIYNLFLATLFPAFSHGQQIVLVTHLQDSIQESSGLIYLNQKLITHNDSGGESALYELDSISGNVTRRVIIKNATNTDWEDICYDSTYIYIADFGNNNGSRTDLKVYRLSILDYFTTPNDTVTVDTINFSYLDQTDFTPSQFSTNFDAEAIISYNDSLFIFTKNWGNNWTYIYALPKIPGTYQIVKIDSINVQGLTTGATYDAVSNTIFLTGYTFTNPFIVEVSNFTSNDFSNGTINRYSIVTPLGSSIQIESITCLQANQYYLTAEINLTGTPSLYRLNSASLGVFDIKEITKYIYPNPASEFVNLKSIDFSEVEIYDTKGNLKQSFNNQPIWISNLGKGLFIIIVKNLKGNIIFTEKLIIH